MIKLAIVYNAFPHYRIPLFCELSNHGEIYLTVFHAYQPIGSVGEQAQTNVKEKMPFRVINGPVRKFTIGSAPLLWHSPAFHYLQKEHFDVILHMMEARWLSFWPLLYTQKKRKGKFILWGIGTSLKPTPILNIYRKLLASWVDALIFHGEAPLKSYVEMGIKPQKCFIAKNSMDIRIIDNAKNKWSKNRLRKFRHLKSLDNFPNLLCVGRLLRRRKLDLLVRVVKLLRNKYQFIKVISIGAGPEKENLIRLAADLDLNAHFIWVDKIISEDELAPWFLSSDIVIAPSQVGLLAIHSHAYGKPLITSDRKDLQGPEVEVLIPGKTGLTYTFNQGIVGLAKTIDTLLSDKSQLTEMGNSAYERVCQDYGIPRMANGIINAISYVTGESLSFLKV